MLNKFSSIINRLLNILPETKVGKHISAEEALKRLKDGNKRFAKMKIMRHRVSKKRREEIAEIRTPMAIVLSCSDSRVPPEIIFDQTLGDLFVVRNAGNIINEHVIGSIEYAVYNLGAKLILVLGHEGCGAVETTIANKPQTESIESIKRTIEPAIRECQKEGKMSCEDITKKSAELTVKNMFNNNSALQEYIKNNDVKVLSGYYHLKSGVVDFFE